MTATNTEDQDTEAANDAPVIEEERVSIPVADPPEKETSGDQEAAAPERKTRKEYRESKKLDWKAELQARDEQIRQERAERNRLEREFAELRGRFSERHAKDTAVDYAGKVKQLRDKANRHLANAHLAGPQNQPLAQQEMDAYYDTLDEIGDVRAEAKKAKEAKEQQGQQTQQGPDLPVPVQQDIRRLFHDFQWLRTNHEARAEADDLIDSMVREGYPNTYATFRVAATQIAQAYKLGGNAAPSNAARQRFAGVGSGEGEGGSSNGRVVKMGDHERKMAEARYPELGAEEAHKKWAREVYPLIKQPDGR